MCVQTFKLKPMGFVVSMQREGAGPIACRTRDRTRRGLRRTPSRSGLGDKQDADARLDLTDDVLDRAEVGAARVDVALDHRLERGHRLTQLVTGDRERETEALQRLRVTVFVEAVERDHVGERQHFVAGLLCRLECEDHVVEQDLGGVEARVGEDQHVVVGAVARDHTHDLGTLEGFTNDHATAIDALVHPPEVGGETVVAEVVQQPRDRVLDVHEVVRAEVQVHVRHEQRGQASIGGRETPDASRGQRHRLAEATTRNGTGEAQLEDAARLARAELVVLLVSQDDHVAVGRVDQKVADGLQLLVIPVGARRITRTLDDEQLGLLRNRTLHVVGVRQVPGFVGRRSHVAGLALGLTGQPRAVGPAAADPAGEVTCHRAHVDRGLHSADATRNDGGVIDAQGHTGHACHVRGVLVEQHLFAVGLGVLLGVSRVGDHPVVDPIGREGVEAADVHVEDLAAEAQHHHVEGAHATQHGHVLLEQGVERSLVVRGVGGQVDVRASAEADERHQLLRGGDAIRGVGHGASSGRGCSSRAVSLGIVLRHSVSSGLQYRSVW